MSRRGESPLLVATVLRVTGSHPGRCRLPARSRVLLLLLCRRPTLCQVDEAVEPSEVWVLRAFQAGCGLGVNYLGMSVCECVCV